MSYLSGCFISSELRLHLRHEVKSLSLGQLQFLKHIRQLRVSDNLFALLITVDVDAHARGWRERLYDRLNEFETLVRLATIIVQPHISVARVDQ